MKAIQKQTRNQKRRVAYAALAGHSSKAEARSAKRARLKARRSRRFDPSAAVEHWIGARRCGNVGCALCRRKREP